MPRKARLDAPGTLHHVIIRGIERKKIINNNDQDRQDFVSRMGTISLDTGTVIYAWALMINHAHILLSSGPSGLSLYMRRLLTGYAISYNRRHRRHGHLFQNRYKSILCEEVPYFKELVRYIHLNPLRANQVENGIEQGRRPDLVGGGLIRSQGGWSVVKAMRRLGVREKSDERILGSGEFVEQLIQEADQTRKEQFSIYERLQHAAFHIEKICKAENVSAEALKSGSRRQKVSMVRSQLARKFILERELPLIETGRLLGVSPSAIAKTLDRLE